MLKLIYRCINSIISRGYHHIWMPQILASLAQCGKKVIIAKGAIIAGGGHITIGDSVYIGPRVLMYSTVAYLKIGSYVNIGPNVSIITGDHRTNIIGEYMCNINEKLPQNDQDVIIEDDVWIGMNASIFKGVKIGRGSVIAGASVVTKDVPPYSIYISKNDIRPRFGQEQIIEHERLLNEKYGI
jgi:acetyltransferase-like isoleucine patch superfamily enzyme